MKRIIFFLIFSFSHFLFVHCENISDVFTAMPDSVFELLTQKGRRDMLDFYNNHMEAKVRNRLNDYSQLDTLTDDFLRLRLSTSSSAEMKLLQTEDSTTIICLVRSITSPVADSRVQFFTTDWQPVRWIELPNPSTKDFFSEAPDSVSRDLSFAQRSIDDLRFVAVSIDPVEPILTFILSVDELNTDEKKLSRRYLRSLRYRWTGSSFTLIGC